MRRLASLLIVPLGSCSLYIAPPDPPPGLPISGGTMLLSRDGERVVVADPERDQLHLVDLEQMTITASVALDPDDEPGRLIEDGAGRIHVALRGGGAIVTLDGAEIVARRPVCAAPRGVAWQEAGDLIHVACATGELVSLPAAGGDPVRELRLERDLRDVIVDGDDLLVSRFRTAELLRVLPDGTIAARRSPATINRLVFDPFDGTESEVPAIPSVAYRTVALDRGRTLMVHQRATQGELSTQPGGYGNGHCAEGPIEVTVTVFDPAVTDVVAGLRLSTAQLPVDVAVADDELLAAIVLAGSRTVRIIRMDAQPLSDLDPCGFGFVNELFPDEPWWGAPTAVAFAPDGRLIIQYDNAIVVRPISGSASTSVLPMATPVLDAGRRRFHQPTFAGLACASCHPEGREDGLVWTFDTLGPRRTQDIAGNLAARAPYHWDADMTNLDTLVGEVLLNRMGGEPLTEDEARALPEFLFNLPAPPAPTSLDAAAVERGRAVFEDPASGCLICHGGSIYTSNLRVDVGTGGRFKVPSLIGVGWRAPYLHDGCAPTLRDRFGACGGAFHGGTETLEDDQIDDLVVFLESL